MTPNLGNPDRATGPEVLRVGIIATAQFTLNALGNFVDVLRLSGDEGDRSRSIRCQWHVMSTTGTKIRASCGLHISPTSSLIDPSKLDYIAVIGGLLHRGRQIDEGVRSYLIEANRARVGLVGICTGSFVLCRLGLMRGRKCCISWYHYRDFLREFHGTVPVADKMYVADSDRVTCSGGIGAALAAAYLVERHLGAAYAQKALHIMQIDKTKPGATLQPAPPLTTTSTDDRVNSALLIMEQNIGDPFSVVEIAARVKISKRTLERLFNRHIGIEPRTAYLTLRVMHARLKLKAGLSLAVIAPETGFASASHLSETLARFREYPSSKAWWPPFTALGFDESPAQDFDQPRVFHTANR